jgi:hypothetical protein
MSQPRSKLEGREPLASTGTIEDRTRQQKRFGHASLTEDEKEIFNWSRERRLQEFQKVNEGVDKQVLEKTLFYIDTITVDSGEILDVLRLNPKLSWEKVRDVFLGGPVDGHTSTFHGLDEIVYPEHFWKATIENERESCLIREAELPTNPIERRSS